MKGYWDDTDRRECTIEAVRETEHGYEITHDGGWCFLLTKEALTESMWPNLVPKKGDHYTSWGSIGRPVRGVAINKQLVFYRTPDEQRSKDKAEADKIKADRIAEYESKRADYDARVAALPAPLRERMEGFRAFGGDDWRWSFEPYELMCCEQAGKMAAHFKTAEAITAFRDKPWDNQKAEFPELDEGHSGNSFGASCMLAKLFIERPDLLAKQHGALCPLVGCEDYGCFAARASSKNLLSGVEGKQT